MELFVDPSTPQRLSWVFGLALILPACGPAVADASTGEGTSGGTTEPTIETTMGAVTSTSTTAPTGSSSSESSGSGEPPIACGVAGGFLCCSGDDDRDRVDDGSDNAQIPNVGQRDWDEDGMGDVVDHCPTVPDDPTQTSDHSDSDHDGLANVCDRCPLTLVQENADFDASFPARMLIRTIPTNADSDSDGVGDACDNCVTVPNCRGWNASNPPPVGIYPVDFDDCQLDSDNDGIGDACEGEQASDAAGPAGFEDSDDFDQDGIANLEDGCPRLPIPAALRLACNDSSECGEGRACASSGTCNHVDTDNDGVGDLCDNCPWVANPDQQDEDSDFVGEACESHLFCEERQTPRTLGFFDVSVSGYCCVPTLVTSSDGDGDLLDALSCADLSNPLTAENCTALLAQNPEAPEHSLAVRETCTTDDCTVLPAEVAARVGVLLLPPGCDAALAAAGMSVLDNLQTGGLAAGRDASDEWSRACLLPPRDTDFDGPGDSCDNCPLVPDPTLEAYVDDEGVLWPNYGAVCNGDFLCH